MSIALSHEIEDCAQGLGEPVAEFRVSAAHSVLLLICGVLTALLGLLMLGFVAYALFVRNDGEVKIIRPAVMGVFLVFGGSAIVARQRGQAGTRVVVFDGGLVRAQGQKCDAMRWQDIVAVHRGNVPGEDRFSITRPLRLALRHHAGQEWVFTESLSGFEAFRDEVERRTLPLMKAAAIEAVGQGRAMGFGGVGVKREGLTFVGRSLLPWGEVGSAELVKGKVVVRSASATKPYFEEKLYDLPNAHVLLALVDHFRGGSA